jgi:uncharacterized protein (DUF433 family)
MSTVDELVEQVSRLTSDEKEELFQRTFAPKGIVKTPNVCGGSARIDGTRIPVWGIEALRRLGAPEAELLRAFPTLNRLDLANAAAYVERHREEIDREIRDNEEA